MKNLSSNVRRASEKDAGAAVTRRCAVYGSHLACANKDAFVVGNNPSFVLRVFVAAGAANLSSHHCRAFRK